MPNTQQMIRRDVPICARLSVAGLPEGPFLMLDSTGRIFCLADCRGHGHTKHVVYVDRTVDQRGDLMVPFDRVDIIDPTLVRMQEVVYRRDPVSEAPAP